MEQPTTHETPQAPQPPLPPLPSPPVPRRSPGLAVGLSFFPGLGHLYLGLYQRGIGVFLAFAAAIWLAEHADLGIFVAFAWFFAVIDGYRQAVLLNQCCGSVPAEPSRPLQQRSNLALGVFLVVAGALLLYNQFYPLDLEFLVDWWPLALILFGVYLLAQHFREQAKRREAEERARQEEGETRP